MRIFVTGASGLIGSRLCPELAAAGHEVVALSRRKVPDRSDAGVRWVLGDPRQAGSWTEELLAADAVFHLAGESVATGRWTESRKQELSRSRILSTRRIVEALQGAPSRRPRTFVCASACGYYGSAGEDSLSESSAPGTDFLAQLCVDWEACAMRADAPDLRVVNLRFGVVLSCGGGALARMLPIFRLGLGGPLGPRDRWFPWIGEQDAVGLCLFALEQPIRGPINVVAPEAVRMSAFARTLGRVVQRPALFPVPLFALRLALGEMGDSLVPGQKVEPVVAREAGYAFRHPGLEGAVRDALDR